MPPRTQKKKTKECYNGSTSTTNTSLIINVAVYLLALGLLIFYKNSMDSCSSKKCKNVDSN